MYLVYWRKEKESLIYILTEYSSSVNLRKLSSSIIIGYTPWKGLFPANGLGTHVVICNNRLPFWDGEVRKTLIILWRIMLLI